MSLSLIPMAIDFSKVEAILGSRDETLLQLLLTKYRDKLEEVDEMASELEEDEDTDDDEEDDEDSRAASLRALSQMLGQAKQSLEKGRPPGEVFKSLGQSTDVSQKHKDAFRDLLNDSGGSTKRDDNQAPYASASDILRHLITGDVPTRRVAFKFMYGYGLQIICQHLGEELPCDRWGDLRGSSWAKKLDKALKAAGVPAKTLSISKHLANRGSPFNIVPRYSEAPEIGYLKCSEVELALAALRGAKLDAVAEEERGFLEDIRGWLQRSVELQRDLVCFSG